MARWRRSRARKRRLAWRVVLLAALVAVPVISIGLLVLLSD